MSAPPTLADVLGWSSEDAQAELVRRPRRYLAEAGSASEPERALLAEVLEPLWPQEPVHEHVDLDAGSISSSVYALLELGAAADLPLSPERWAQVATSGIAFSSQATWLHAQYTSEGAVMAVSLCPANDVRAWEQLVAAIPNDQQLPEELVAAVPDRMTRLRRPDDVLHLSYIGDRLAREGHLDVLETLQRVPEFADSLDSPLARAGSSAAAERLLTRLIQQLRAGERVDRLELDWFDGISDRRLTPLLMEGLAAAIESGSDAPFGPTGALISTIRRLGDTDTVAEYDALIEGSDRPEYKFLRKARDELVEDILRRYGQEQAATTAGSLGLPLLESEAVEGPVGEPNA